jgi:citrate synthase
MPEAVLRYGDQELSLPVVEGVQGNPGIDISSLLLKLGVVAYDPGFANTAEGRSAIAHIDGDVGILQYRGYPIEQLAEHATFLEVAYLLNYGELPTQAQLAEYQGIITQHTMVREDMKYLYQAFPHNAHPMQIIASAVSALATHHTEDLDPLDPAALDRNTKRLLAKLPTLVAWAHRYRTRQPYVYPNNDLDYTGNFLNMVFSVPAEAYHPEPVVVSALNLLLVLHADHGQNLSTSAVRLVGSGHAHIFSAIASGIHALSGPLHGGANQEVLEMLERIVADGGDVAKYVAKAKDKNDPFRLMGFGHRVYKNFDPRARIIKKAAEEVLGKLGVEDPLLDVALQLDEVALSDDYFVDRKLYPNVDFYSGIIYRAIGFPTDMFTVMFALGRLPGWLSQYRELMSEPGSRLFRPRQIYSGRAPRDFVPLQQRG